MRTKPLSEVPRNPLRHLTLVAIIATAWLSTGCEEDVNPFIGTDFPFTVWGFVNPKADTQAVRVFTIDDVLRPIPQDPLDAVVSIINVSDNQRYVLRDSAILISNGEYRHIFWSVFPVNYGETFRVEVERSDGVASKSADVIVPPPISLEVLEPNLNAISEILLPVAINGDPPSMPRIDAWYVTYAVDPDGNFLQENPVLISYASRALFRNGTWQLNLDLREDYQIIRQNFTDKEIPPGLICLSEIKLSVHVANEEWSSPTGTFDPDFLVEPGTLSNIENGFGLFGAGYVETVAWSPPATMQVRAGFFDCAGG